MSKSGEVEEEREEEGREEEKRGDKDDERARVRATVATAEGWRDMIHITTRHAGNDRDTEWLMRLQAGQHQVVTWMKQGGEYMWNDVKGKQREM